MVADMIHSTAICFDLRRSKESCLKVRYAARAQTLGAKQTVRFSYSTNTEKTSPHTHSPTGRFLEREKRTKNTCLKFINDRPLCQSPRCKGSRHKLDIQSKQNPMKLKVEHQYTEKSFILLDEISLDIPLPRINYKKHQEFLQAERTELKALSLASVDSFIREYFHFLSSKDTNIPSM